MHFLGVAAQPLDEPLDAGLQRKAFYALLALVTAAPLIGLGFGLGIMPAGQPHSQALIAAIVPFVLATSFGHVVSTSFIYLDQGFGSLIRQNRQWFIVWPAATIVIAGLCFACGPSVYHVMYIGYYAWQLWHFQRQNYGLVSFAAQSRKLGKLPDTLSTMLNLGTASGVLAVLGRPGLLDMPILWWAALVPLAASTVLFVWILATEDRVAKDPLVIMFAGLGWAFFIPTLLSPDPVVSLLSYGIAHGAQYLVFMAILARGSAMKTFGPPVLAVMTGALAIFFYRIYQTPVGAAIYTGVVMGHFVVDAKLWRLREPLQRGLIRTRFGFLFG